MNLPRSFAVIVVCAFLGASAGFLAGSASADEYEVSTNVPLGQVLVFPSWESNSQSARFAHTMRQSDLQELAASSTGLPGGFRSISALTSDGSPIVGVSATVADVEAGESLNKLIDLALAELLSDDIKLANQTILANEVRLNEVDAELAALFVTLDLAPNTDLGELYNNAKFGVESAQVQLAAATDDYWLTRLPGDIASYQKRLDVIGPILDDWYQLRDERQTLRARVDPASKTVAELTVGQAVLDAGDHRRTVTVAEVSQLSLLGRFVSGGIAIGVAIGLLVITAFGSARNPRVGRGR